MGNDDIKLPEPIESPTDADTAIDAAMQITFELRKKFNQLIAYLKERDGGNSNE